MQDLNALDRPRFVERQTRRTRASVLQPRSKGELVLGCRELDCFSNGVSLVRLDCTIERLGEVVRQGQKISNLIRG
jgi:hypothetical protein